MPTVSVKWFGSALTKLCKKQFDLSTDVLKLAIATNAIVPTINTPLPHWGGTGTTNLAANQVATTGTSYTGPITLTNVTVTDNPSGTGPNISADIVTVAQDAAGPTNCAYGYVIDWTDPNKSAIGWVELSAAGTGSLVSGRIEADWNGATDNVLLKLTAS